jgi:hypothetical protein
MIYEVNMIYAMEVSRKIGYWQHMLLKIEGDMLKLQSKRLDMKERLAHLHRMQVAP